MNRNGSQCRVRAFENRSEILGSAVSVFATSSISLRLQTGSCLHQIQRYFARSRDTPGGTVVGEGDVI